MGLAADFSYAYPEPNWFRRLVQGFATTRLGARLTPMTLVPLDRLTDRVTNGRVSLPMVLAGLPVLELITVGRKTGLPRATHVIAVPFQDTLALLGTNFGQPMTPAWAINLEHHPQASVSYGGTTREVVARPATADDRAAILRSAKAVFGGTAAYEQRLDGVRRVRIFVLEPSTQRP
jgi:deazaflavin-dependent oxidoreductase (nitroreductase family)